MTEVKSESEKFNCTVNIVESGVWKKKITVVIPREEIDAELAKQFGDLRQNTQLPGFRKGRAPKRLVEKRFGEEVIEQTKFRLLARAFEQVEDSEDFDILGEPDLKPDDIVMPETGDFTFEYEVEVKPEFDLPELEGIRIEKQLADVTEQDVDKALSMLCNRLGTMEEVDVAQADDHVMTDIVLKIEGIDEPIEANEWPLWVCPCTVKGIRLEDIAPVLTGVKRGDVKQYSTTISEDHKEATWQGKKVDMEITVQNIKRLKPAELTEEFAKNLGVESVADLRRHIEEDLDSRKDAESSKLMAEQVFNYLDANTNFDLPVGVTSRYAERLVSRRVQQMLEEGVSYDDIARQIEEIRAMVGEDAAKQMKMSFIMENVCQVLDISASDAEVNSYISSLAYKYGRRPEKMREELVAANRIAGIRDNIAEQKAIAQILEMAEVVDKAPENDSAEKPAKKATKKAKSEKTDNSEKE